uniref:zinc finger protein ZAT1-like n=1 Tax=Erigeron canadensis TaxID=72917 RepID=UPI001CB9D159|nr:zinc finger protein ZAT1-like [Erigeron canadensis]
MLNPNSVESSDQEVMKHMCRLCNKSFPCGRSLGGHMRSHLINSSDHHDQKMKIASVNNKGDNLVDSNNTEVINGYSNPNELGYELRKDPKKTLKAVINGCSGSNDFVVLDKICKECGKGFQSWKALFGHMKCHSDKILNNKVAISNQDSRISQFVNENPGVKIRQTKKSRSKNGASKKSIITCAATFTDHTTPTVTTASSSVSMSANYASTSVVSDIDQDQEAEIAMCLIMLSRDSGKWDKKLLKSSSCGMKKVAKTEVGFDSQGTSGKCIINEDQIDDQMKRKFDCMTCNKSFHSYQALGGHKASHKKLKGCLDSKNDDENMNKREPVLEQAHMINGYREETSENHQTPSSFNLGSSIKNTLVLGAHECSICSRVFSSGQALGGHKKSHLIAEAKLNQHNQNLIEKFDKPVHEIRGFLDLNMPPDDHVDEEEAMMMNTSTTGTGFNPWYYKHESTLLGLLSTS